jgi:hypothetical protein
VRIYRNKGENRERTHNSVMRPSALHVRSVKISFTELDHVSHMLSISEIFQNVGQPRLDLRIKISLLDEPSFDLSERAERNY